MLAVLGKGTEAGSLDVPVITAARVASIEENKILYMSDGLNVVWITSF